MERDAELDRALELGLAGTTLLPGEARKLAVGYRTLRNTIELLDETCTEQQHTIQWLARTLWGCLGLSAFLFGWLCFALAR